MKKRSEKNGSSQRNQHPTPLEVVYAFSHVETWIEDFAKSSQLSSHELTVGVAELLQRQTLGAVLGLEHRLPEKPGSQTAERSDAMAEMEMAGGTRGKVQRVKRRLSASGLRAIRRAQKIRWARSGQKSYWAKMTAAERKAEMHRRMSVRALKTAA